MLKIGIYSRSAFSRSGMRQIVKDQDVLEFDSMSEARKKATIFRSLILLVHESDFFLEDADKNIIDDELLKVVVVAPQFNLDKMIALFNKGARGYQLETASPAIMLMTLNMVSLGELALPSMLAKHLAAESKPNEQVPLSAKEMIVVRHLAIGSCNKQISRSVGITEATTKVHVKAIMRKLGVSNRTQAAVWAVRNGFDRPVART